MADSQEKIYLSYQGSVLYDTIGDLIGVLKESMFEAKVKQGLYKKVLMIMIEALENIFKYHEYFEQEKYVMENFPPKIKIKSKLNKFTIECSNPIRKSDKEKLQARLDHINCLDKIGVKAEYKQIITNGQFSEKGGAGLGIIEMAKISDGKLVYSFNPINNKFENYNLSLKINCG